MDGFTAYFILFFFVRLISDHWGKGVEQRSERMNKWMRAKMAAILTAIEKLWR